MTSRVLLTARYTAVAAALVSSGVFMYGVSHSPYDFGETCRSYGERFDDSRGFDHEDLFPVAVRCNESFDLVPSWVNPVLVALLIVLAVSIVVVIVCELRRGLSWWRTARRPRRDGVVRALPEGWETGRR